jgi:hypothetical protein
MDPDATTELHVLAHDVGIWHGSVVVRPTPDAPDQKSEGTLRNRMCGSWLVSEFKNKTSGFEGHGIYGWDSALRRYVGTWVDPMRRSLVVMEGTWDPEAQTLTFVGEMKRPDGTRLRWREVTERPASDVRVFRSFVPTPDGSEYEVMTVRYERLP